MNVIYSSDHFWVLAYPAELGLELFDKYGRRTLFLQGPSVWHFRHAMEEIPEEARDDETIDAFLDNYCDGAAQPIVFH